MRIGIDLGGTKTEGILMDANGSIVERLRSPTPVRDGYDAILDNIVDIVRQLESPVGKTCRVGIGTPGSISSSSGRLRNSNTTCLNDMPVLQDLERKLERDVRLANDANCFALSEAVDGAGQGHGTVFGVIMGTGVGGGIIINRSLHQGAQHIAGEWGHNVLDPGGPDCYCGRKGCIETYLSGPGLLASWRVSGGDPDKTPRDIAEAAAAGDPLAQQILDAYLDRFGQALSTVINILDPDVIVLGGGLSNIPALYREGKARLATHVFNDEFRTPVVPNRHGDSSGVRGAAWLWHPEE